MTLLPEPILPVPANEPNAAQNKMIQRRYGLFIHYGINTFADEEWTEGTLPANTYAPNSIDTDQWVKMAKDAGMKYVIMTTKHHEGFCLWPTMHNTYNITATQNTTDVIGSLAASCKKYDIELGLYYSLWDRHWSDGVMRSRNQNNLTDEQQAAYVDYMCYQLTELLSEYGPICELWFDGGWAQPAPAWNYPRVYDHIKKLQPDCAIGINWTIGHPDDMEHNRVLPKDQQAGFPIRCFPSDFRLADPHLPNENDPKLFTHEGKTYYLPFESTICLNDKWFYNTTDKGLKTIEELAPIFRLCTANDNIFVLNSPPNRDGVMPEANHRRLKELATYLKL